MSDDNAVRARVEGKAKVAQRTAWSLEVGHLRVRCLKQDDGSYVVQARGSKGWTEQLGKGADPLALLRATVSTQAVARSLVPSEGG